MDQGRSETHQDVIRLPHNMISCLRTVAIMIALWQAHKKSPQQSQEDFYLLFSP
jgi:hypothetical protein